MNEPLALARAIEELETWSFFGQLSEGAREQLLLAAKRVQDLEKERDELLTDGVYTKINNLQEQLSQLHTAYKQALEAIEHKDTLLKVYLRRAESKLSSDDRSANYDEIRMLRHAITPLAIELMKEGKV